MPTRLLGRPAVVLGGVEGVRRSYDDRLRRRGAVPPPVELVLFGPRAVHGLDDDAHHHRKARLLDVLTAEAVDRLRAAADAVWAERMRGWAARPEVTVFDEAVDVLGAAVLPWAGIDVDHDEQRRRSR